MVSILTITDITHQQNYTNYKSNHALTHKKSVIRALAERAFSHTTNKEKINSELDYINNILKYNNFPDRIV